jgi:hypothetical protein
MYLTKAAHPGTTPDREPDETAGLEVTPAMARAGARLLAEHFDSLGDGVDELVAREIFSAMMETYVTECGKCKAQS